MEIPTNLKKELLTELEFILKKVEDEEDATRKLYFLSAASSAVNRTMRYYLQNELLIAYMVLNTSYAMLNDRINRIKAGDVAVTIPDNWANQVVEYLSELVAAIKSDGSIYPALEKLMRLAHSVTGPGYYIESYYHSLTSEQ